MSHRIPFIQDESCLMRITWLERLDRGDPLLRNIDHLYYNNTTWRWDEGGYTAAPTFFGDIRPDAWAYVFHFSNGTTGTCRVSAINAALAALGAQVV